MGDQFFFSSLDFEASPEEAFFRVDIPGAVRMKMVDGSLRCNLVMPYDNKERRLINVSKDHKYKFITPREHFIKEVNIGKSIITYITEDAFYGSHDQTTWFKLANPLAIDWSGTGKITAVHPDGNFVTIDKDIIDTTAEGYLTEMMMISKKSG